MSTVLVVHHRVRDYDAWKPVFDEHADVRKQHGAVRHWLYRTAGDPNDVVVAMEFGSQEHPSLREAMERAGVEGEPDIHVREEIEEVRY